MRNITPIIEFSVAQRHRIYPHPTAKRLGAGFLCAEVPVVAQPERALEPQGRDDVGSNPTGGAVLLGATNETVASHGLVGEVSPNPSVTQLEEAGPSRSGVAGSNPARGIDLCCSLIGKAAGSLALVLWVRVPPTELCVSSKVERPIVPARSIRACRGDRDGLTVGQMRVRVLHALFDGGFS